MHHLANYVKMYVMPRNICDMESFSQLESQIASMPDNWKSVIIDPIIDPVFRVRDSITKYYNFRGMSIGIYLPTLGSLNLDFFIKSNDCL